MADERRPTTAEVLVRAFEHVIQDWGRTERAVVLMVTGGVLMVVCSTSAGPVMNVITRVILR